MNYTTPRLRITRTLQIIMLSTLLTTGSTEFMQAWSFSGEGSKPMETKAPVETPKTMNEIQSENVAKTKRIAEESMKLKDTAQQNKDMAKQVEQQSKAAYDNSIAVKAYDATLGKVAESATQAWDWMTGKAKPTANAAPTSNQPGNFDFTTKPRANTNPETVSSSKETVETRTTRTATDPGQEAPFGRDATGKPYRSKLASMIDSNNTNKATATTSRPTTPVTDVSSTTTSRTSSPALKAVQDTLNSTAQQTALDQTSANALDNSIFKKPAPKNTSWFSGASK